MTRAFIGLGSNQGDSFGLLQRAQAALDALPRTVLKRCSHLYRTTPVGEREQPDFINAVVELDSRLDARELLRAMQRIESSLGRRRNPQRRWGPRTIDLDLLLFGNQVIGEPGLTVPHPRMGERAFVLEPLAELAPGLEIPGLGPISRLRALLDASGVRRLQDHPNNPGA